MCTEDESCMGGLDCWSGVSALAEEEGAWGMAGFVSGFVPLGTSLCGSCGAVSGNNVGFFGGFVPLGASRTGGAFSFC